MSAGSKIVPVRMPAEMLGKLNQTIAEVNKRRRHQPYDISSFIRQAILDKINHYHRSRKANRPDELWSGPTHISTGANEAEVEEMIEEMTSELARRIETEIERRESNA